jgi:hypothetical protein
MSEIDSSGLAQRQYCEFFASLKTLAAALILMLEPGHLETGSGDKIARHGSIDG